MSSLPLAEVRRRFFDGDDVPENSVPQPILHSWRRCLGLGLPAGRLRQPERLDPNTLQQRQQASADWLQLAKPAIDALFDSVVDDGHVVIVADADGVILNQMGHPAFLDRAERVALLRVALEVRQEHPNFRLLAGTGTPSRRQCISASCSRITVG